MPRAPWGNDVIGNKCTRTSGQYWNNNVKSPMYGDFCSCHGLCSDLCSKFRIYIPVKQIGFQSKSSVGWKQQNNKQRTKCIKKFSKMCQIQGSINQTEFTFQCITSSPWCLDLIVAKLPYDVTWGVWLPVIRGSMEATCSFWKCQSAPLSQNIW